MGAWAGSERAPKLPAREILKAIVEAESSAERKLGFISSGKLESVQWEVSALPWATLSWMYFNMDRTALEQLRRNVDSQGQPLF
jgi:hypothetical protein